MHTTPEVSLDDIHGSKFFTEFTPKSLIPQQYTQSISFSAIKLPNLPDQFKINEQEIFYHNDFAYEKERVKQLANTELYNSLQAITTNKESQFFSNIHSRQENKNNTRNHKLILIMHPIVSIIFILYGILNLMTLFFAIIALSIYNMEIVKYIIWLLLEFTLTSFFLFVFTRGYTMNSAKSSITFILLGLIFNFCAFIITHATQGIGKCIYFIRNLPDESNSYEETAKYIIIVFFFFSCVAKFLFQGIYLILSVLLRIWVKKKEELVKAQEKITSVVIF